jgi:hypothetical protein
MWTPYFDKYDHTFFSISLILSSFPIVCYSSKNQVYSVSLTKANQF